LSDQQLHYEKYPEHVERGKRVDDLAQEIYQLISQSFMRLDTADHLLMRRFGLTLTQSWALVHLSEDEGHSLSELANLLICDKSNVTGIIDKLEEDGLAVRKRGKAGDRRYTRVVLTESGHQLRRRVIEARKHMVSERLRALSEHDLLQLHSSLQNLAHHLVAQFESNEEAQIIERAYTQNQASALTNEV
jgi:DNA-binding MarR family transcriptional regulator